MPRNNKDFIESALFHGTAHPFQIGDVITPQMGNKVAYATKDIDIARERARDAVNYAWSDRTENETWPEFESKTPPRVFTVEPLEEGEPSVDEQGHVVSRKGFKVTGEV